MDEIRLIASVTQTMIDLIESALSVIPGPLGGAVTVEARSPREMVLTDPTAEASFVSMWLYRVDQDAVNRPVPPTGAEEMPSFPRSITLHYLVSARAKEPNDEQTLLGVALKVFADHPVVAGVDLKGSLQGDAGEVRITPEPLTIEDLTRVWRALGVPLRTSLAYGVQVLAIDGAT